VSYAVYGPERTGLVLIDTVNDVFSEGGKAYPTYKDEFARIGTFENLKRLLTGARERGIRAFFAPHVLHRGGLHILGTPVRDSPRNVRQPDVRAGQLGADFHPDLKPAPGEITISPHKKIDVLATTDPDVQRRQHGVEYVAIAGMIGTMCVESTARSAMERGYHVTTFTDATAATGDRDAYEAMVRRYPLISHATVTVDEFLAATGKALQAH
jgi:nicotinamidase-related amidase